MAQQSQSIPTRIMSGALENIPERMVNADAEVFNQRGVELYESEQYDDAIEQFRQALALDPRNSLYHCNLAVAFGEQGDADRAFEEYERALTFNPSDVTALLNLGYAYNEREEPGKARHAWEQIIDISPNSAEADEARDNLRNLEVS